MNDDDRRPCTECRRLAGITCTDAISAGISRTHKRVEMAQYFREQPQRCPAFVERAQRTSET